MASIITDFATSKDLFDGREVINDKGKGLCIATDSLFADAKKRGGLALNVAYTNYGGAFIEKCLISFMKERYPEHILCEETSWDGENAFIFGEIAEIIRDNSFLAVDGFEDYFLDKEYKLVSETADDLYENWTRDQDKELTEKDEMECKRLIQESLEYFGHCETFGFDYYEPDIKEYIMEQDSYIAGLLGISEDEE